MLDFIKKYIMPIIALCIFIIGTILYVAIGTTPMSVAYMFMIFVSIGIVMIFLHKKYNE